MKILLLSSLLLSSLINSSLCCWSSSENKDDKFDIQCTFTDRFYLHLGRTYHCDVRKMVKINSPQKAVLRTVTGKHESDMYNGKVEGFYATSKEIEYFPRGLTKIFEKLIAITIRYDILKNIHQDDLKEYTKIESLIFEKTEIEVLEADLFKNNPNIKVLSFDRNKIMKIDEGAFDHMPKLFYFILDENICINERSNGYIEKSRNLAKEAPGKCSKKMEEIATVP